MKLALKNRKISLNYDLEIIYKENFNSNDDNNYIYAKEFITDEIILDGDFIPIEKYNEKDIKPIIIEKIKEIISKMPQKVLHIDDVIIVDILEVYEIDIEKSDIKIIDGDSYKFYFNEMSIEITPHELGFDDKKFKSVRIEAEIEKYEKKIKELKKRLEEIK